MPESIHAYQDRTARDEVRRQLESDEDHEYLIVKQKDYHEEDDIPPRNCNYCGTDWPCDWGVSKGLLEQE